MLTTYLTGYGSEVMGDLISGKSNDPSEKRAGNPHREQVSPVHY